MGRSTSSSIPTRQGAPSGRRKQAPCLGSTCASPQAPSRSERMHPKKFFARSDPNPDKGSHGRLPYPRPSPPVTPWHLMPFGRGRPHYHYGLFAGAGRFALQNTERVRQLLTPGGSRSPASVRGRPVRPKRFPLRGAVRGLRRADDHRRNFREGAPCASPVGEPDQDRHLMTVAKHPSLQRVPLLPRPRAGAGQRWPRQFAGPPPTRANAQIRASSQPNTPAVVASHADLAATPPPQTRAPCKPQIP